jgi:hypothetical protein
LTVPLGTEMCLEFFDSTIGEMFDFESSCAWKNIHVGKPGNKIPAIKLID